MVLPAPTKKHKRFRRYKEALRDLTQVKQDVADGVKKKPGETNLPEDLPGRGKFYCNACSRYFLSANSLAEHKTTKMHKRRLKAIEKHIPYTEKDAEMYAGLGTDNGIRKSKDNNNNFAASSNNDAQMNDCPAMNLLAGL